MLRKQVFVFMFSIGAIFLIQSCKKGCTDKNAFNFSPSAKVNDGDCLYCDSSNILISNSTLEIEDDNPQSQFAFETVLQARLAIQEQQLNGNGCRLLGYNTENTGNSGLCTNFSNYLQLINLTSKKITFTGQVTVTYFDIGQTLTYNFNSAQVQPFDSLNVGNIGNVCNPESFPDAELNNNGNYSIQYN